MTSDRPHLVPVDKDSDPHGQRDDVNLHLNTASEQIERCFQAIQVLRANPSADPAHDYLEAIRLMAEVRDAAARGCTNLAFTAHHEPSRVSMSRLAAMTGLSEKTLRKRFAEAGSPAAEPFTAF